MRTIAPLVGLLLLLLGSGSALAQPVITPLIPPSHTIWKTYSDGGVWKWGFHTDAQQQELPGLKQTLEGNGYKQVECGINPPEEPAYAVCAYLICPDNGCPYGGTTPCPTPRPVMKCILPPSFCYQPCPPVQCVQVCKPACERPRLFPLFRRCR